MRRHFLFLFILLPILSGITAAQARPYGWTVWLHYGRHMTLVNAAGESLREAELPLPEGDQYTIAPEIAVSHNGTLIAYLVRASTARPDYVMIYDSISGTTLFSYRAP